MVQPVMFYDVSDRFRPLKATNAVLARARECHMALAALLPELGFQHCAINHTSYVSDFWQVPHLPVGGWCECLQCQASIASIDRIVQTFDVRNLKRLNNVLGMEVTRDSNKCITTTD